MICFSLRQILGPLKFDSGRQRLYDLEEDMLSGCTKSTADRIYYAQVLIFKNKFNKAIPILNTITEEEGDYSLSVVICRKHFGNRIF